jgi:hypothetical protein
MSQVPLPRTVSPGHHRCCSALLFVQVHIPPDLQDNLDRARQLHSYRPLLLRQLGLLMAGTNCPPPPLLPNANMANYVPVDQPAGDGPPPFADVAAVNILEPPAPPAAPVVHLADAMPAIPAPPPPLLLPPLPPPALNPLAPGAVLVVPLEYVSRDCLMSYIDLVIMSWLLAGDRLAVKRYSVLCYPCLVSPSLIALLWRYIALYLRWRFCNCLRYSMFSCDLTERRSTLADRHVLGSWWHLAASFAYEAAGDVGALSCPLYLYWPLFFPLALLPPPLVVLQPALGVWALFSLATDGQGFEACKEATSPEAQRQQRYPRTSPHFL